MIDQLTIQKIFDAAEIHGVVSDFVTLKKRGVNYIGLCPFHNEKTPSFIVSPSKGIYKCFGCGKGGNAVNFVMEIEQFSYVEALKYLANKYGIPVEERELTPSETRKKNERESMLIVSSYANEYFKESLNSNEGRAIALSYFKERGFRADIIDKFELGYCSEKWDGFTQAALDKGYQKEFVISTGLTIDSDKGLFDRFRARVIFPIHGVAGKVIAFGGRTLKADKKIAKYLNSPESLIYHKSRVLYGLFQAKKAIVQQDKCYLVEGYTDVLSFYQSGIENVVASSGTSLTVDQIRLIKRFSNNITIIYDGDAAGIKASLRGIDIVLEQGLNVKVLLLPNGEDPDSFARSRSSSELTSYISSNEVDFIVFKTNLLLPDTNNDPILKARLISNIVKSISVIPEGITRSVYVKECSSLLEVDERVLYEEIAKIKGGAYAKSMPNKGVQSSTVSSNSLENKIYPCDVEERMLIKYMLFYGNQVLYEDSESVKVGEFIVEELLADDLGSENPLYIEFFKNYKKNCSDDKFDAKRFFRDNSNQSLSKLAVDILSEPYELSKVWTQNDNHVETEEMKLKELVPKVINEYKKKKIDFMLRSIQIELAKAQKNGDDNRLKELFKEKMSILAIRSKLLEQTGCGPIM